MRHWSMLDISMYQIQMFLALAEERNFLRAASRMNVTQPTLSKRISVLEDTLGIRLFDRLKRPIALTKPAMVLYDEWTRLSDQFENSLDKAFESQQQSCHKLTVCTLDSARLLNAIPISGQELEGNWPGASFSWEYASFTRWRNRLMFGEIDIMLTMEMERPSIDEQFNLEIVVDSPKLVCMLKTNPLSQKEQIYALRI